MKIAVSAYPIDFLKDWAAYEAKLTGWVAEAAGQGAELLVFPEYGGMELASLDGAEIAGDMELGSRAVDRYLPAADKLHDALARQYGVHIVAGSAPVWDGNVRPFNRSRFFGPDGPLGYQDKQIMTRFERDHWKVAPGHPLKVFDTALGKIGILICYDSEFPLLARSLIEAGAEILVVPSTTETPAGYHRVRVGSMARALESQCVVAHAPHVGLVPWCYALEAGSGAAGIYGPPDKGFPDTGIIAMGEMNQPGWVYGDVSLEAIREVRADGRVLNMTHWAEQAPRIAATKPA